MSFRITYTKKFEKNYASLSDAEKLAVKNKIKILYENPLHPSLRTKRIQGTDDLFECSVNMDIRIIWYYEDSMLIILLDIGHHDILNRY